MYAVRRQLFFTEIPGIILTNSELKIVPGASGWAGLQRFLVSTRNHGEVAMGRHHFLQSRDYLVIGRADRFRQ